MKIMLKAFGLVSMLALGALMGCSKENKPIEIKFSHVVAPDTPKGRAADRFRELVAERSGGAVKVTVYPNSQLYKDKEEIEALQLGSVQMLAPSLAKFGPLGAREFEAFDLPYIFEDYEAVHKVTQGPVGSEMLGRLKSKGILGLAFWDNGFKQLSANQPIRTPADMRGLKFRIQSSKVLEAQMRALGALPQVLAFSEVYQALQTGVVDGTENPPSNLYTQKMHEVQKHLTLTGHGYLGYAVIVNAAFWEGLPTETRAMLEAAMADATRFANEIARTDNEQALEKVRLAGKTEITSLTPEEREAWRQALLPVHEQMAPTIGKDLIESIYQATAFRRGS